MNNKLLSIEINLDQNENLQYRIDSHLIGEDTAYDLTVTYFDGKNTEEITLEDISRNENEAISRACLFAKEKVTPITSQIIMEELLSVL